MSDPAQRLHSVIKPLHDAIIAQGVACGVTLISERVRVIDRETGAATVMNILDWPDHGDDHYHRRDGVPMIQFNFIKAFSLGAVAAAAIWIVGGALVKNIEMIQIGMLQIIAAGIWYQKGQP